MKYSFISKAAASTLLVGILAACGGGGDTTPVAAVPAPTTFTVAGTAATGAAFDNATITIIGSDGKTYPAAGEAPVVTGTDGSYSIILPLTAKPPFVVQAVRSDISLVSVIAEAKDTTTNITPVTNLIASRLSSSGDPAMLAAEFLKDPTLLDLAKITASVAEVVKLIQPLMDAVGDSTDPLNGNIQAAVTAGTGADKMLDSLSISITPSSATGVNIQVSVKQKQAEGEQPTVIAFKGGTGATAPSAALPTVVAANLVPDGNAALIADLLTRMSACYALPLADRVASGGTAAADIKAAACKDMFVGNDPATYLNSGAIVSSTGAFSGLFSSGADGATFDLGSYAFTRGNGDLVIAYRLTSGSGNISYSTLATRIDTDKKLRAIGNQYAYSGAVTTNHTLTDFVNHREATYYASGYSLNVNNELDASSNPIFDKVVVTSPAKDVFTLKVQPGSPTLRLVRADGTTSRTVNVRVASAFADASTSGTPANTDTTVYFTSPQLSDAELELVPDQGVWKFEYYLVSAPSVVAATQNFKTRARAMTIAEFRTQKLAALADADLAYVTANSIASDGTVKNIPAPATGPFTMNWVVPKGAYAPRLLQVFGFAPIAGTGIAFDNRNASIKSTAATDSAPGTGSGDIACSPASASDKHCDNAGNYVPNSSFNLEAFTASDPFGRDFTNVYVFYAVTIK
jgi:hypothetical protein